MRIIKTTTKKLLCVLVQIRDWRKEKKEENKLDRQTDRQTDRHRQRQRQKKEWNEKRGGEGRLGRRCITCQTMQGPGQHRLTHKFQGGSELTFLFGKIFFFKFLAWRSSQFKAKVPHCISFQIRPNNDFAEHLLLSIESKKASVSRKYGHFAVFKLKFLKSETPSSSSSSASSSWS